MSSHSPKIIIAHVVDILYCIIESLITPINVCNRSHSLRNVYSSNPAVISEYLDMAIPENAAVCLYRGLNVTGDTIYIDIQDIDSHKTITHSGIIYDMIKYSKAYVCNTCSAVFKTAFLLTRHTSKCDNTKKCIHKQALGEN